MRAEFIRPRILTLVTTHQCTAACDHCCFACSPKVTKRIPYERLTRLIDEALAIPTLHYVSFVGGECFLLGEELDEHFAHCIDNGLEAGTTTNGYWAVNQKAARRRMRSAAAAGLSTISLSTGEMHAKFVPVERIVFGAIAACEEGLHTEISIESFRGTTFDSRSVYEHPAISSLVDSGRLAIIERDWVPHADGKGEATLRHDPERSLFATAGEPVGCHIVLDDLTVTPDLQLVACCGYPVESIPDLAIGSLRDATLREALESAPENLLALWLHVAGPERMLRAVKRVLPAYELPLDAVHPCQACLHLHRDPVALRILNAQAPAYREKLIAAYDAISTSRLALATNR